VSYELRFTANGKRRTQIAGNSADGYSRADAERELAYSIEQVRRGVWRPPEPAPSIAEPEPAPSFHEQASDWFARHRGEWRQRTQDDYLDSLTNHLLPHFKDHLLGQIDAREIDRYVAAKVAEGRLGASQINKTLLRLGQVLAEAEEYGLIDRNPLEGRAGRRRKLKTHAPKRTSLNAAQARALFAALAPTHRTMIRTALMAGGLRVTEVGALRWRDVKLASGKLQVVESKTDAGVREVDLAPELIHELREHKARSPWNSPSDFVFPGKHRRRPRDRSAAGALLKRAIKRANVQLEKDGGDPIPEGVTFHSLRRSYATMMAEAGAAPAYVMGQIGHRRSSFTLDVYTDVTTRRDAANARLGALLSAPEKARNGANGANGGLAEPEPSERESEYPA
jgi:integrase